MKILAFVDTHGSEHHIKNIIDQSRYADVLVCAGDFTVFENDMNAIMRALNSIGKPVMIIPGNHESGSSVLMESSNFKNMHFIHKGYFIREDLIFFGYGGGGFSMVDNKFDEVARSFMKTVKDLEKRESKSYRIVLVTHAPPYGNRLDDMGGHVGCKNFASFIYEQKPVLAISGHMHENAGAEDKINSTMLINPGPKGKIIDI